MDGLEAVKLHCMAEPVAESDYVAYQNQHGHPGLITSRIGLVISVATPYIAASPFMTPHTHHQMVWLKSKIPIRLEIRKPANQRTFTKKG